MSERDFEKNPDMMAMTPTRRKTDREQIEHNMTNHPPTDPVVVGQFEALRRAAKMFAHAVLDHCPDTRERSLALTNAEQALMWAVASVARNQ